MHVAHIALLALAACAAEPTVAPVPSPAPETTLHAMAMVAVKPPSVPPAPPAPSPPPPPPRIAATEPRPAMVPERAAPASVPAVHGSSIAALAITDDARAAVTVDALGTLRLWPSLDGRIEPVVVAGAHAVQVAIGRDRDALVIATLDRAGSLGFVLVQPTGAVVWCRRRELPRPVVAILATRSGFVATTDDHRLLVFTPEAEPSGELVPEPGTRIATVITRGDTTVALLATSGGIRGRWIGNGEWGESTAPLPIDPYSAALSPDGTRLVARRRDGHGVLTIALATGRTLEKLGTTEEPLADATPLGFLDGHTVAIANFGEVHLASDGTLGPALATDEMRRGSVPTRPTAVGDGVVVRARDTVLVVITARGAKYLGFRLPRPQALRALDRGALVTDGQQIVRVDDRFGERERYAMPKDAVSVTLVDARHALAIVPRAANHLALVALDLDDPDHEVTLVEHVSSRVMYQPATRLYAAATGDQTLIGRYDPARGTFDGPISIPGTGALVLPAHGALVVIVKFQNPTLAVTKIRSLDFAAGTAASTASVVSPVPLDFDGYLHELELEPPATRGALTATLADQRITLRDGTSVRWVAPSHGILALAWSARGELIGLGHGLGRLDLATGTIAAAHCGWEFGLWDELEISSAGETLCDAAQVGPTD